MRLGIVFVLTAPSGAGKTSLSRAMVAADPGLCLSVSYTTRAARSREREGEHYHFISESRFQEMVLASNFMEHALVHGHHYGTSHQAVAESLKTHDVLVEIDWQGAAQIRAASPYPVVDIFITPPSLMALEERLRQRGEDSEAVIQRRLSAAEAELKHISEFQFVVNNEHFDTALGDLMAIVRASRLRYKDRDLLLSRILSV